MDKIRIYKKNNVDYIELPRTKNINYKDEPIAYETEMANGRIVMDIMGVRPTFTVTFEYMPTDVLREIITLLRVGGFFEVEYPSPLGRIEKGKFKITEDVGQKIFKFVNGEPMWYGTSLTFVSQAVINND